MPKAPTEAEAVARFRKNFNTYRRVTAISFGLMLLCILFGKYVVDPQGDMAGPAFNMVFFVTVVVWAVSRVIHLRCTRCGRSFLLHRWIPNTCPKCTLALR